MADCGIYAWFGYVLPLKERLRLIKDAGFSCVLLWWGDEFRELDGDKEEHPALARRLGLRVENAHAPYADANDLWDAGLRGDAFEALLKGCIKSCAVCEIPTLVLHVTDGPEPPPMNTSGALRLARLAELGEKIGVKLAVENVQRPETLDFVFSQPGCETLGFCYDSGHAFACAEGAALPEKFGSKLCALHLHDNNSHEDQHLLPGEGGIDWPTLAGRLRATAYHGPVTLESAAPWSEETQNDRELPESYLRRAFEAACRVEHWMLKPSGEAFR
ncbi:MAG: sugar phosphate isomerase/epimerase [Clostridia bacterium]|nr:sugar phosphate isomerase/epimerase [Clostridia bacterium]